MSLPKKAVFKLAGAAAILLIAHFAAADVVRVTCVGASITYGYGLRDREANAYPVWLGRWLGTNYAVRNFGVSATPLLHRGDCPWYEITPCRFCKDRIAARIFRRGQS